MTITFQGKTKADVPNCNGTVFTRKCVESIRDQINARAATDKPIPIIKGYENFSLGVIQLSDMLGSVKKATIDESGRLMLETELFNSAFAPGSDFIPDDSFLTQNFVLGGAYCGEMIVSEDKKIPTVDEALIEAFVPLPKDQE